MREKNPLRVEMIHGWGFFFINKILDVFELSDISFAGTVISFVTTNTKSAMIK